MKKILIELVCIFLVITACCFAGCAFQAKTADCIEKDPYSNLGKVQLLNYSDFDQDFAADTSVDTFTIKPLFRDEFKSLYTWIYCAGDDVTLSYKDNSNYFPRRYNLTVYDNNAVTFEKISSKYDNPEQKYMIFGSYRDSTFYLYTFRINWEKRQVIFDGGISFTSEKAFNYLEYYKNYCEGKVQTILEWKQI